MKQSPAVYPANVLTDTHNRQQIATILQSMGFETDDIQHAFAIFERSYGDKKYDISILSEIVFQLQNGEHPLIPESKQDNNTQLQIQSHSAPNSPNVVPLKQINQQILHENSIESLKSQDNHNSCDMLSIFNSLDIKNRNKAASASPQTHPVKQSRARCVSNPTDTTGADTDRLQSLKKYTSDETEIIDVLLQTLNNNNNEVFNNMVNWNDLSLNIKQRNVEWNEFQKKLNYKYDRSKHREIETNINNHKASCAMKLKSQSCGTGIQCALQYEYDVKRSNLFSKKDKLLITANTYSILKNNKSKTELMITKCNEKLDEINGKIRSLQKEKKQYFSALIRTKNKLLFQIESIKETETSIKELHETTNEIQTEMNNICGTKECVDTFEKQLHKITNLLRNNLNQRLEANWSKWSNRDIIIWIKHIENERFNACDLSLIAQSSLSGKDLPQMNDFILRSFKIKEKNDRDLLLKNIKRIIKLKATHIKSNAKQKKEPNLCVVCGDGEANHIMIPCGHIALCSKCVNKVKQYNKCPFCRQKTTNIIKCFHVGF